MRSVAICIIVLLLSAIAFADERLVDQQSLTNVLETLQPGDILIMKDGIWKDAQIRLFADGTQEKPITLRAQTPGKVILSGKSRLNLGGSWLVVDGLTFKDGSPDGGCAIAFRGKGDVGASNCRVTNCAIIDYNAPPESGKESEQWVSLYGTNNRVDHCYFKGKTTASPTLIVWVEAQPNNHQIDHNHFAGRPALGKNGGETVRVGTSEVSMNNSRTVVESNLFEHCDGESEIISSKSCENVYRHNTFIECKGGLTLRHGNRNEVYGNWFFGNGVEGTGGIRLIGEDQKIYNNYLDGLAGKSFESAMPVVNGIPKTALNGYFRVQRATVCFNTLVNCTQNITFGVGAGERNRVEPPMDCIYANNVIVGKDAPLVAFKDRPINTNWMGNFFFGATTGLEGEAGVESNDPLLKKGADGIWRPDPASPVIGAAAGDFAFVNEDIEGRLRDKKKDAGCFQIGDEAKRRPLTAKDVGPVSYVVHQKN